MKHWIKTLSVFLFFFLVLLPKNIFAHPGNTASDGCHYCRTNCDKWGVPWNERHCHSGGTIETVQTVHIVQPTSTPRPTATPTKKPTSTPTKILTPTNTPISTATPTIYPTETPTLEPTESEEISPTSTSQPQILGETDTSKPTEPPKTSDIILGFSILGLIGFGIYKLFVKIKNKIKDYFSKK